MKKNSKGITLVALVITIVVMLMVASIGITMIQDNKNTVETADNISKNKTYQTYKEALEMAISEKQVKDATKIVDEDYLKELKNIIISKKPPFADSTITLAKKTESEEIVIYIETKEGYKFEIGKDLIIKEKIDPLEPISAPESEPEPELQSISPDPDPEGHDYYYYNLDKKEYVGKSHPTEIGHYDRRCVIHENETKVKHDVLALSPKEQKDENYHYVRSCSCGLKYGEEKHSCTKVTVEVPSTCTVKGSTRYTCECGYYYIITGNIALKSHDYYYFDKKNNNKGKQHPTETDTWYYIKCKSCGLHHDLYEHHTSTSVKKNTNSTQYNDGYCHYVTCSVTGKGTCWIDNIDSWPNSSSDIKGIYGHKCTRCGATGISDINSICKKTGNTSHKHFCNICNLEGNKKHEHNYTNYTSSWYDETKHKYKGTCSYCGATTTTYHPLVQTTEHGVTVYSCKICGYQTSR